MLRPLRLLALGWALLLLLLLLLSLRWAVRLWGGFDGFGIWDLGGGAFLRRLAGSCCRCRGLGHLPRRLARARASLQCRVCFKQLGT